MNIKKQNLSDIAIKNSMYTLSSVVISKIGGLVMTIILARLLLPELFGIYSLALSVAIIAITFSDLGANLTALRYMSDALGKNDKSKARSYFRFLFKIKGLLILVAIIIILIIAKPLSASVFNKPLVFLPIVFSCFYILIESAREYFSQPFAARKDLRIFPPLEFVLQSSKIILSLIAISILSYELRIPGIFIAFAISGFLFLTLEVFLLIKKDKEMIIGKKSKIDSQKILKYMGFMGLTGITLAFFGSIDTLMLGRFVGAEYLGFYRAALTLVISISSLLPLSVLLPIFTQINGKRLDRGFDKSFRYLMIFAIPMVIGLMFIAKYAILMIYGKEYLLATPSLFVLSFLIIISPITSLYSTLFQAKEKPKLLAKFVVISLVMNIILNYILIKILITISQEYAILGAGAAILISNLFFLGILISKTKSQFKIKINKNPILKSILATAVMALFLWTFQSYVDINIFSGAVMIIMAIVIYFSFMFLIKGINKEDVNLLKIVFRR
ncbi:MAG: oligosaccharide flippase family protein [Nanoarchaeota archaeon]|nr:oligosaccharide flippase family protein [Nanoarchaeota archaeon]